MIWGKGEPHRKMSRKIDLLNGNISSVLLRLSAPIIASNFMFMAYSLVDTLWVGSIGTAAVTAVATAGNWLFFSQGLATITQTGAQILVGQRIGEGELDKARAAARLAIITMLATMIFYLVVVILFRSQMVAYFGIKSEFINQSTRDYMLVTAFGTLFMGFNYVLASIYTATGDSKTPFIYNSMGVILNIIADPIFIFGLFGMPKLGVIGAGLATTLSEGIVSFAFLMHIRRDNYIFGKVENEAIKTLDFRTLKTMMKLGFPPALQLTVFSLVYMVIGRIVTVFGDTIIGIQRVASQIESICFQTANGFSSAMNSYTAQNFGANNHDRIKKGYGIGVKYMLVLGILSALLFLSGAEVIMGLFIKDSYAIAEGANYLHIMVYSQVFVCLEAVGTGAFGGVGKTHIPSGISTIFTIARIPFSYMFIGLLGGVSGVWWAITVSSIIKGSLITILYVRYLRNKERSAAI